MGKTFQARKTESQIRKSGGGGRAAGREEGGKTFNED